MATLSFLCNFQYTLKTNNIKTAQAPIAKWAFIKSTEERSTWRSGVRSAMRAASQLPGRGPTDVDDAPAR